MKTRTKVVVIGGGIAGCSTLYHLTREGWSDVMLLERDELTSGTTWHSAAQVTNFGMTQTMVGLKSHSIALYQDLAADPDYPVGYHHGDGGIRLANTEEQMQGFHHFSSMARGMGVDLEVIDAEECARRHPLISTTNLLAVFGIHSMVISIRHNCARRLHIMRAKPGPKYIATHPLPP